MTESPSLKSLLEVPEYRKYFSTTYKLPGHLLDPHLDGTQRLPWRVWIKRPHPDRPNVTRWRRHDYPRYAPAYNSLIPLLKAPGVTDVAVTCRPKGFPPTIAVDYALRKLGLLGIVPGSSSLDEPLVWCCYCRRPVEFLYFTSHHAFTNGEVINVGESRRCPFCGIRRELV